MAFSFQALFRGKRPSRVRNLTANLCSHVTMPAPSQRRRVMLVFGAATFLVALLQLVVKLIELNRR